MTDPLPHSTLPPMPRERGVRSAPIIPDHDVIRQIGSGAYGAVWLAKSLTGAWRAVKVIYRNDFDDERTFNREFEGILNYEPVARNHPGLMHILHVGRKEGDNPFYYCVMELADDSQSGTRINPAEYVPRTLQTDKKLNGDKPLPLDYCLEVGSQLSHALLYLHSKGLTHRDIKPSNVIFVNGRPKLADIGLVAQHDQRSFVGTEGFIPPEGPGTQRADVYALAKVLYEITTGKDRLDFPDLPEDLPEGVQRKKWQTLNSIICHAAEPRESEASIVTAHVLAEAIDSLRGFSVTPKFRFPRPKRKMKSSTKLTLSTIIGAVAAAGLTFWITKNYGHDDTPPTVLPVTTAITPSTTAAPIAGDDKNQSSAGFVIITSNPVRASIHDLNGVYIDETPYGPFPVPAGQKVTYILKKEGYADREESGVVEQGKTLVLGGTLTPYHPPVSGIIWSDALGMRYIPEGDTHVSETPVTKSLFEKFAVEKDPTLFPGDVSFEAIPPAPNSGEDRWVLANPNTIRRYVQWLSLQCETMGILGKEFSITPEPVPGFSSKNGNRHAYRLVVSRIHQVPISVTSNPPGASVFLDQKFIGFTPLIDFPVNQKPYSIEVKLSGHTTQRRSGLDPEGLYLSLNLERDGSVVYKSNWKNSLGMEFVPLNDHILVQNSEVTRKEFLRFVESDKSVYTPPDPGFRQGENHPIVNITKKEADLFAEWLTREERAKELIEPLDQYRLPSDEEWSAIAGLPPEQEGTPYERSLMSVMEAPTYYWGYDWPPKNNTGNFADKAALAYLPSSKVIVGYSDGFPYTAPVRSFEPNKTGVYDIDGNVQEWTGDAYGGGDNFEFHDYDVARGANYLSFKPGHMNPTMRTPMPPGTRDAGIGFRLILVREPIKDEVKEAPADTP